ncbi:MAG: hypothetical protein V1910_00040 [bacterium]
MLEKIGKFNLQQKKDEEQRKIHDIYFKKEIKKRNKKRTLQDKILEKNKTTLSDVTQEYAIMKNESFDNELKKKESEKKFERGLEEGKLILSIKISSTLNVAQTILNAIENNETWKHSEEYRMLENDGFPFMLDNIERAAKAAKKFGINNIEGINKMLVDAEKEQGLISPEKKLTFNVTH